MIEDLRIELIDDDPSVFGPATAATPPRHRPRWVVPAAVVAALAVAVVGLLVWQPWHHDPEPPLSNRLALASQPFNEVESVEIDAAWDGPSAAEVGFVYADPDPDATLPRLRNAKGRSLRWVAYAADSAVPRSNALVALDQVLGTTVATIDRFGATQLDFGPIDGRRFTVTAFGLTRDEIMGIAQQIAVVDGEPVLRDESVLVGMEPIGTLAEFDTAVALAGGDLPVARQPLTEVVYVEGDGRVSVASTVDPDGAVERMLRMLVGGSTEPRVDGRTQLTTDVSDVGEGITRAQVAWRERGRLIVVRGPGTLADTRTLAETVVELPASQWQQIAGQATAPGAGGFDRRVGSVGAFPATIGLIAGGFDSFWEIQASPSFTDDGKQRSWSLCLMTDVGADCNAAPITAEPPSVRVHSIHGREIIVALAPAGSHEPMLRITRDGEVELHLLFRPGGTRTLPGPTVAVEASDDMELVELLVDGEVVATL